MKLDCNFDDIIVEYTIDKNNDKIVKVLKANVFTIKYNKKFNLAGIDIDNTPRIYYNYKRFRFDVNNYSTKHAPMIEMSFMQNSLHSAEHSLLIKVKLRKTVVLMELFFSLIVALILAVVIFIPISFITFDIKIILILFIVLVPFTVKSILCKSKETYNNNYYPLIYSFEKLLQENDIVFRRTAELKEKPVWLQKIKNIFS